MTGRLRGDAATWTRAVRGKRGRISVVLHKTELVALGIGHDDDYALVVVVPFAGGPSSQAGNELDSLVDVVDGHVKMDADLPCLRLGNRLEDQPRLGIAAMAQVDPAGLRRPRLATEQGAPEARHPLRVHTVDGHSRHEVRHVRHLTVAPSLVALVSGRGGRTENRAAAHIFGAFSRIREWFESRDNVTLAAINFYKYLSESVYIIWYEAPADVESTTLFTRLNVGRIPLTDAELVKALLLTRAGELKREREIAAQWDTIERDLRVPELWAFVTGRPSQEATHITLLLDTLAVWPKGRQRPLFHTFSSAASAAPG